MRLTGVTFLLFISVALRRVDALSPQDMAALARRVELVKAIKPMKAVVMSEHYLVPKQRLRMHIQADAPILPLLKELYNCDGSLALLGIDRNSTQALGRAQMMKFGVEACVETMKQRPSDEVYEVCLLGGRVFEFVEMVKETVETDIPAHYLTVRGRALNLAEADSWESEESSSSRKLELASKELQPLVECWMDLVKSTEQEGIGTRLTTVLDELGPLPPVQEYSERALWAAALINPHPSLGGHPTGQAGASSPLRIAEEVRPSVLLAPTAIERLEAVKSGLINSIVRLKRMQKGFDA